MKTVQAATLTSLFEKFHQWLNVVLADSAFNAADGYLPTLYGLKVDENVNSSLAEPTALVSLSV